MIFLCIVIGWGCSNQSKNTEELCKLVNKDTDILYKEYWLNAIGSAYKIGSNDSLSLKERKQKLTTIFSEHINDKDITDVNVYVQSEIMLYQGDQLVQKWFSKGYRDYKIKSNKVCLTNSANIPKGPLMMKHSAVEVYFQDADKTIDLRMTDHVRSFPNQLSYKIRIFSAYPSLSNRESN